MYIACHNKTFQQMDNLKNNGYAGIDISTHVHYFLRGIDKPSVKTAEQICKSQDSYSINFHACTSYLMVIVHKSPAAKQVNIAATNAEVNGLKHKNRDVTDQCLPPAKYLGHFYKTLSLWKTTRKPKPMGTTSQWPRKTQTAPCKAGQVPGVCCSNSEVSDQ